MVKLSKNENKATGTNVEGAGGALDKRYGSNETEDTLTNRQGHPVEMSQHALRKYQSLVFEDNDFLTYFTQATPLKELGELNIGSRPTRRKNSSKFEDLRAIPWVFAWTQSRQMIPAWYGAGTGFSSFLEQGAENLEMLQNMYE